MPNSLYFYIKIRPFSMKHDPIMPDDVLLLERCIFILNYIAT